MPQSAFIVRPFGHKPFVHAPTAAPTIKALVEKQNAHRARAPGTASVVTQSPDDAAENRVQINFDAIEALLIGPALQELRLRGATTGEVIAAGNIREDMFNRLITADLVIADVSLHNPNVYYELGLRQAFRDKFTFLVRCDLNPYPFDLQTDRYFEYQLGELIDDTGAVVKRLAAALRKTLNQYRPDSPVFKLMPQLEAEDRSRFLSVPEDFREEVERASRQRQPEMLDLLALECGDHLLWEVEGLRVVGRAQFEANFIEGAKRTWERIVSRYPDDAEANTVLSTVYQRLDDRTRSEQALARVSRSRSMSPARQSEIRGLTGRNFKAAWTNQWRRADPEARQAQALRSPLLQRAIDAYLEAFKIDMNHSYAGLNALTLMVIQAELIGRHQDVWRQLLRDPGAAQGEYDRRIDRIDQLALALQLSVEAERDRLAGRSQGDPWFAMLEAAVMCTVSRQPEHVAQLYVEARYYGPPKSDASMASALRIYQDLGIRGIFDHGRAPKHVGTLGANVDAALAAIEVKACPDDVADQRVRLLVFVGLRVDEGRRANPQATIPRHALDEPPVGDGGEIFPSSLQESTRRLLRDVVNHELAKGGRLLGIAGGSSGGDILFHEVCRELGIPTQMFLALTKPQYIGEYVAPAGGDWVDRFHALYLHNTKAVDAATAPGKSPLGGVKMFSDSLDLPRWLQDQEHYNVGRRCTLWMLQHAHSLARNLGAVEPMLIALHSGRGPGGPGGFGGIRHAIRLAQMQGVAVKQIEVPAATPSRDAPAASPDEVAAAAPPTATDPSGRTGPPVTPAATPAATPARAATRSRRSTLVAGAKVPRPRPANGAGKAPPK